MTSIRYLTVQEVIAIDLAMIQRYSPDEQIGVKDSGLLESAVLRPQSSAFGADAYPTIFEKAIALFQLLGQNQESVAIVRTHCFNMTDSLETIYERDG